MTHLSQRQLKMLEDGLKGEAVVSGKPEVARLRKLLYRGLVRINLMEAGKAYYWTTNLGEYHARKLRTSGKTK